jgi:hypothetical protein
VRKLSKAVQKRGGKSTPVVKESSDDEEDIPSPPSSPPPPPRRALPKDGKKRAVGKATSAVKESPADEEYIPSPPSSPPPPPLRDPLTSPPSTDGKVLELENEVKWLKEKYMEDKREREKLPDTEYGTDRVTCLPDCMPACQYALNTCSHLFTAPCLCVCR